jgi:hypothetical protein
MQNRITASEILWIYNNIFGNESLQITQNKSHRVQEILNSAAVIISSNLNIEGTEMHVTLESA